MSLNKGIWDPRLRGTNIKGTNLKSLIKAAKCRGLAWNMVRGAYNKEGTMLSQAITLPF